MMKIGLASSEIMHPQLPEDLLLQKELIRRGFQVEFFNWEHRPRPDYDLVVIRTVWNYYKREKEFRAWLQGLQDAGVAVINPLAQLQWNIHKSYLLDLQAQGSEIIPTTLYQKDTHIENLPHLNTGWVVKPCVSGGAYLTDAFSPENSSLALDFARELVQDRDILIQPFIPQIRSHGEWSLVYFDGQFSHSVLKKAKLGDYRVQSDHGGTVHFHPAKPEWIQAGNECLRKLPTMPVYARVDGLEVDGVFRIMELEILEPELFLTEEHGLTAFADAIERQISTPVRR